MNAPSDHQRLAVRRESGRRPVFYQSWNRLLFLHWQWDPEVIQSSLPKGLFVDTFEGKAYIGVVPFFMNRVRPRFLPPIPWLSYFMELNVRTYVFDEGGNPGVYFYSLDTNRWIASTLARAFFHLNYQYSHMRAKYLPDLRTQYISQRFPLESNPRVEFEYAPVGITRIAQPGSLEFFLIERYLLFSVQPGSFKICSGQVWHEPYEICEAEVLRYDGAMIGTNANGLTAPARPADIILFSPGVDVKVFPLTNSFPVGS